jgi:putative endonuclease
MERIHNGACDAARRRLRLAAKRANAMDQSPGKPWYRRWFGTRSERDAARYLKSLGYRIVARNFSCAFGELDLVALDRDTIVFVEVRSTERDDVARPAASVDIAKQKRLTRLALHFLQKKKLLNHAARFDVVCMAWPPAAKEPIIDHIKNAFEAHGRFQMYS